MSLDEDTKPRPTDEANSYSDVRNLVWCVQRDIKPMSEADVRTEHVPMIARMYAKANPPVKFLAGEYPDDPSISRLVFFVHQHVGTLYQMFSSPSSPFPEWLRDAIRGYVFGIPAHQVEEFLARVHGTDAYPLQSKPVSVEEGQS